MSELTDFLSARFAEDEEMARVDSRERPPSLIGGTTWPIHDPERRLVECKAKRQILEQAEFYDGSPGGAILGSIVLTNLALPYADHPDYREEWRA